VQAKTLKDGWNPAAESFNPSLVIPTQGCEMTSLSDRRLDELQGRHCTARELEALKIWAQSRIHWSASIQQAIAREGGYLVEIDADPFSHAHWYGVDFDEVELALHMAYLAIYQS
jgi:hypothetical protein